MGGRGGRKERVFWKRKEANIHHLLQCKSFPLRPGSATIQAAAAFVLFFFFHILFLPSPPIVWVRRGRSGSFFPIRYCTYVRTVLVHTYICMYVSYMYSTDDVWGEVSIEIVDRNRERKKGPFKLQLILPLCVCMHITTLAPTRGGSQSQSLHILPCGNLLE